MFLLKKLLTAIVLPPFSLFALALLGVLLTRRHPRTGRWLAGLSLLSLLTLSLPITSSALHRSLEIHPPVKSSQLAHGQAIVVLAGGIYRDAPEYGGDTVNRYSLERIRYAATLQKRTGLPMLVTGGAPKGGRSEAEAMKEVIERELGGKVRWVENRAKDTQENANLSAAILWTSGITRIILVSHAWHLQRAVPLFERQGIEVIAAPTAFASTPEISLTHFLPSASALAASHIAMHEWLGFLVQRPTR